MTLAGDNFDSIALDFYGEEFLSPTIIQANPEHRNTIIFNGGEVIRVPIIEQESAVTLPPWKRV
jgi:hypothetical protein